MKTFWISLLLFITLSPVITLAYYYFVDSRKEDKPVNMDTTEVLAEMIDWYNKGE